jgi:ferredoxin-NADP reductase
MAANEAIKVRVKSVTWEAECVNAYDLRTVDGAALPPFTAGAHIDLHLPTGVVRSYSIANAQRERHRYVVGVSRDARSRGGSTWIHERLHAGDVLSISPPRNNFALFEGAPHSVLIGGGIGVTPLLSMVARLEELKRPWTLYYAARSRAA